MRRRVVIANDRGLHARAAAKFVKLAGRYDADVMVANDDTAVSGLSIMGLMMLAAAKGAALELRANGDEAAAALAALAELVANRFDEDT
ncbi:MAG: HPr family phosphocarrier protein [Alphaproteobacteria bacterium]